jgi:probable selenium-dependent hydroxylase accessory protein YqeC
MIISEPSSSLLNALEIGRGIVCLVGAGGKKTTLYRLAMLHPGRVGITSTATHIPPFPDKISAYQVITDEGLLLTLVSAVAKTHRLIAYAQPSIKKGHLAGLSPALIGKIHRLAGFDISLVKADEAPNRWIKAPGAEEPIIPKEAATVIPIVSALAIGQPLSEKIAYRIEQIETIIRIKAGEILKPIHLARLLASPQGSLKGVGKAKIVPLINMIDGPTWEKQGIATAEIALSLTNRFDRVVLARMNHANPLVKVIRRL